MTAADPSREWLVLVDAEASPAVVAGLRTVADVRSVVPPRLVVAAAADPAAMEAVPGVREVLATVPESLLRTLSSEEALAARAFARRQATRGTPGPRPGEGLSWDAPGFEPPDYPAT